MAESMQIRSDLAPPTDAVPADTTSTPLAVRSADERGSSAFSKALAQVEHHRSRVRAGLTAALLGRLIFEFQFVALVRDVPNLMVQVPYLGIAMLSYLLVLMWLAARTRDRFGFGMALGIGVLEATYLIMAAAVVRPFIFGAIWPPMVVAIAHIPMAIFAFQASTAYPPTDSKRPWIVGFVTALVLLAIPWIAPTLVGVLK